jgi:hypothetical protein
MHPLLGQGQRPDQEMGRFRKAKANSGTRQLARLGSQFELLIHEGQQLLPVGEVQVAGQGP